MTSKTRVELTLPWIEDLAAAKREAAATGRPIVSLRLLGRLDEALSCANSRFFRAYLYPDPRIAKVLRERFVLHWESVRPVPLITIDMGDGRTLVRTLTGNSAHLVLDAAGRPVDAIPGLYGPAAFLRALESAETIARAAAALAGHRWRNAVAAHHREQLKASPLVERQRLSAEAIALLPEKLRATRANEITMSKRMIERPVMSALETLERNLTGDTEHNERELHPRIRERFAAGLSETDPRAFTEWIYRELFLMPPEDPWLGLKPEAFSGLEALEDASAGVDSVN